jgi:hypothetical protein
MILAIANPLVADGQARYSGLLNLMDGILIYGYLEYARF